MSWKPDIDSTRGPKYLAVVSCLAADIRSGRLQPGHRLPSQRQLAKDLRVDLTTITRAFNEARRLGLIEANAGRGSFIRASPTFSHTNVSTDATRVINLSNNTPPLPRNVDLVALVSEGIAASLAGPDGLGRLSYQDSAGAPNDRLAGARWLSKRLGNVSASRVLVMAGGQTALFAIMSTLLKPGDRMGVPSLTFSGVRAAAELRGLELIPIAIDDDGLIPASFQECCEKNGLTALYCTPTMHNPTTATMPQSRREEIARLAERFRVKIIEDDAYGALPSSAPPPLAAFAPQITWHIASLSKCVTPALRIAYVVTPGLPQTLHLTAETRAISMIAPPITAALCTRWIAEGILDQIVEGVRAESAQRQSIAHAALRDFSIRGHPEGFNVWLTLPDNWKRADLRTYAIQSGVAVVTSDAFAVGPQPEAIRLSLGAPNDRTELEDAMNLLAVLLSQKPDTVWEQWI